MDQPGSRQMAHSNLVPNGTSRSGTHRATLPSVSWNPVTRHSDTNGPICFFGKLTTPTTSFPTSSAGAYSAVTCALDLSTPISAPKQIGPLMSECLVTGFHDAGGNVALCVPDREVPLGTRLL